MVNRRGLQIAGLLALTGCSAEPVHTALHREPGALQRVQAVQGGFVTPALPPPGLPAAGRTGMYVRWLAPVAVALRGGDLLVADGASGRLWRADVGGGYVTGLPLGPFAGGALVLLGPDLSAWVLDPGAGLVLRVGRDGRLRQSLRLPAALLTPVAMALADDGLTLRLADGLAARWLEQRSGGPFRDVEPRRSDGGSIGSIDGFAPAASGHLYVLDRLSALVHRVEPGGKVVQTLGRGELMQPVAIASDRRGRVYVHEAQDGSLKRLDGPAPARRWTAQDLGVQRVGALAVDGRWLAVADPLGGQVVLFDITDEAAS